MQLFTIGKQPTWSKLKLKNCWNHLLYSNVILLWQNFINQKFKIEGQNRHIYWTNCWISKKFSGKMGLIKFKSRKEAGLYPLSRKFTFWKNHSLGAMWAQSLFRFKNVLEMENQLLMSFMQKFLATCWFHTVQQQPSISYLIFKASVRYLLWNFYFSPNGSPLKITKNVFYFI